MRVTGEDDDRCLGWVTDGRSDSVTGMSEVTSTEDVPRRGSPLRLRATNGRCCKRGIVMRWMGTSSSDQWPNEFADWLFPPEFCNRRCGISGHSHPTHQCCGGSDHSGPTGQ